MCFSLWEHKLSHDVVLSFKFISCIKQDVWDLYTVYKTDFYFQKHSTVTIKACHDIFSITRLVKAVFFNTYNRSKPLFSVG